MSAKKADTDENATMEVAFGSYPYRCDGRTESEMRRETNRRMAVLACTYLGIFVMASKQQFVVASTTPRTAISVGCQHDGDAPIHRSQNHFLFEDFPRVFQSVFSHRAVRLVQRIN